MYAFRDLKVMRLMMTNNITLSWNSNNYITTTDNWQWSQWKMSMMNMMTNTRWFKVTFSSPSWRSLNPLKGSLNHPKKVTKNCQVCFFQHHSHWLDWNITMIFPIVMSEDSLTLTGSGPTQNCDYLVSNQSLKLQTIRDTLDMRLMSYTLEESTLLSSLPGWWLNQPIWKICSSNWTSHRSGNK